MTYLALARAVRALAPTGVAVHVGEAPQSATLPWVVLNVRAPGVRERSLASSPLSGVVRVQATCAATSEDAVLVIAEKVAMAFEGARPVAAGWQCSPLRQLGDTVNPYQDTVVIAAVNKPVVVAAVTFEAAAVRIP